MAELYALGSAALLAGYRQRQFSPVEVVQSVLERIARWEPTLCATYLLRPELALDLLPNLRRHVRRQVLQHELQRLLRRPRLRPPAADGAAARERLTRQR